MRIQKAQRLHHQEIGDKNDDPGEHLNEQKANMETSLPVNLYRLSTACRNRHNQTKQCGANADDERVSHPRPEGFASQHS